MAKHQAPDGKVLKGWTVRLEPEPEQAAKFRRDCGARRFAYNWAVTSISLAFDAGRETGGYDDGVWSAYSLRKRWNQAKHDVAPWWAENSKEAYSNGIADAVTALKNWHGSRTGKRAGPRVQFPRRKKKNKGPAALYLHDRRAADRRPTDDRSAPHREGPHQREHPPAVAACPARQRTAAFRDDPRESRALVCVAAAGDRPQAAA